MVANLRAKGGGGGGGSTGASGFDSDADSGAEPDDDIAEAGGTCGPERQHQPREQVQKPQQAQRAQQRAQQEEPRAQPERRIVSTSVLHGSREHQLTRLPGDALLATMSEPGAVLVVPPEVVSTEDATHWSELFDKLETRNQCHPDFPMFSDRLNTHEEEMIRTEVLITMEDLVEAVAGNTTGDLGQVLGDVDSSDDSDDEDAGDVDSSDDYFLVASDGTEVSLCEYAKFQSCRTRDTDSCGDVDSSDDSDDGDHHDVVRCRGSKRRRRGHEDPDTDIDIVRVLRSIYEECSADSFVMRLDVYMALSAHTVWKQLGTGPQRAAALNGKYSPCISGAVDSAVIKAFPKATLGQADASKAFRRKKGHIVRGIRIR